MEWVQHPRHPKIPGALIRYVAWDAAEEQRLRGMLAEHAGSEEVALLEHAALRAAEPAVSSDARCALWVRGEAVVEPCAAACRGARP